MKKKILGLNNEKIIKVKAKYIEKIEPTKHIELITKEDVEKWGKKFNKWCKTKEGKKQLKKMKKALKEKEKKQEEFWRCIKIKTTPTWEELNALFTI